MYYIIAVLSVYNNFLYKAVVFCSAKSRSYVSEAILIAQKLYPITLLINNQVYKQPFIFYGSYPEVYANVQTATIVNSPLTAHFWICGSSQCAIQWKYKAIKEVSSS